MKFLRLLLLVVPLSLLINSCQKPVQDIFDVAAIEANETYKLMTPAYYRETADENSIQVRFYESERIYDLAKTNASYGSIKNMLDEGQINKSPLRIYIDNEQASFITITAIQLPSQTELQNLNNSKVILPFPVTIKKIIPSMDELNDIFQFCKEQGCVTGTAAIDYCIPFQYVVDGCYARAHKMRQILENDFGYSCEKVFSYEGPTGYLAVDAGTCCVYWWYHVAPLVTVKMERGYKKYVIDPSMFDEPVTIETWTAAQENFDCTPFADFGYSEITPGYIYSPGGWTDNFYYSTNYTLQVYADLVTCP